MKRFAALLLVAILLLAGSAAANPIDLSGLSFEQLVALRDQLNLAIWNSQEWKEVTVPAGVWKVGEDIPAGHWSFRLAEDDSFPTVYYCDILDSAEKAPGIGWNGWMEIFTKLDQVEDLNMKEGMYFINNCPMIFTPYIKPDFSF